MIIELLDQPAGDAEPEYVREACCGLQLVVSEPPTSATTQRTNWVGNTPTGAHADGWYIDIDEFMATLEAKSQEAAQWCRDNIPGLSQNAHLMLGQLLTQRRVLGIFFGKQYCRVISE